ncbi:hypothetical protein B0H10DRAFT_358414 [Mycena sp. CBHHK59/15]|nr:hypothetical protein B0H10DRAFT_358414 [Mycena sp. CBHHK59/15]
MPIKIKKEAFTLACSVVAAYLDGAKPFKIYPPPKDSLYVSRAFLRVNFGGNDQHFVVHFKSTDGRSGRGRAVVFPKPDLNPCLPRSPGAPGLIFASRHEIISNPPWALFCRDKPSGEAVWRYMGDYENGICGQMTVEQFNAQTTEVKETWGKLIVKTKRWDVYVSIRARIALRKSGIAETNENVAREMNKIRKRTGIPVTPQDVIQAFSRGEHTIDIIKMQCVSYDHTLVEDIARQHENPAAVADRERLANQHKVKRVRKRPSTPATSSESDFELESESDDLVASVERRPLKRLFKHRGSSAPPGDH